MMHGIHNGELALQDQKIEPLEHNEELGVYVKQSGQDQDFSKDTFFAQFNPKHRLLATAGSGFVAHLWDLRRDDFTDFIRKEIPHLGHKNHDN